MKIIDQVIRTRQHLTSGVKGRSGDARVSEVSRMITRLLEDRPCRISDNRGDYNFKNSFRTAFLSEQVNGKESVISCSIWRNAARYLDFSPDDGMEVRAYGSVSHYEPGGSTLPDYTDELLQASVHS